MNIKRNIACTDYAHLTFGNYDSLGNPCNYKNNVLQWNKRDLMKYGNCSFQYNSNGIRTSKNANGISTEYLLEGSKIIKETRSTGKTLWYYYDASGLIEIDCNGIRYFVEKDMLGNIVRLADIFGDINCIWKNNEIMKLARILSIPGLISLSDMVPLGRKIGLFFFLVG